MVQMLHTPRSGVPDPVYILGVRVDRLTQSQVLDVVEATISLYHTNTPHPQCQQLVTVNPEFVITAQHNALFRQAINQSALVVADGVGIVWASRYLGKPTPERVTGVDTLISLAQRCAQHRHSLYLLGAAPGVAESAAARLQELAPGLQIAGTYAGSPDPIDEDNIIERLSIAHADVLCVAYGAPAQDLWIERNLTRLPVALAMGVGGSFDFLTGKQRRAPRVLQRLGLEWLYRLYREPWRWRRMLALPKFAIQVILKGRKSL
jgi:N-acetylglucosaminyldiphosphoundecaprenol N-acetyl-beta-D-mannosaminyltransferase